MSDQANPFTRAVMRHKGEMDELMGMLRDLLHLPLTLPHK
jgi:hypothetical protein